MVVASSSIDDEDTADDDEDDDDASTASVRSTDVEGSSGNASHDKTCGSNSPLCASVMECTPIKYILRCNSTILGATSDTSFTLYITSS